MSFLRKQESISFKYYWTPAFAGVTEWELLEVFLSLALQVKSFIAFLLTPKWSGFFTLHKGGGEAEKPFRAITFGWLKQPWGLFNHHLFGELLRSIAQIINVSHSKRVCRRRRASPLAGGISASLVK